jgi:hypothetical protein
MLSARNYNNKIIIKQAASQEQVLINGKILSQNIVHPKSFSIGTCSIIFRKINKILVLVFFLDLLMFDFLLRIMSSITFCFSCKHTFFVTITQ